MKVKVKKTTDRSSESIEPKEKKKRPYSPPTLMVLTPDQARMQLAERALPGAPAAGPGGVVDAGASAEATAKMAAPNGH